MISPSLYLKTFKIRKISSCSGMLMKTCSKRPFFMHSPRCSAGTFNRTTIFLSSKIYSVWFNRSFLPLHVSLGDTTYEYSQFFFFWTGSVFSERLMPRTSWLEYMLVCWHPRSRAKGRELGWADKLSFISLFVFWSPPQALLNSAPTPTVSVIGTNTPWLYLSRQ